MTENEIVLFLLVLFRVSSFLTAVPMLATRNVPRFVKVGLAMALTMMWYFTFSAQQPPSFSAGTTWFGIALLAISEITIGLLLGIAFGVFLYPARIAGAYITQEMGVAMLRVDSGSGDSTTIGASLMEMLAIALFFVLNIHHLMFWTLHISFERLPLGTPIHEIPTELCVGTFARMDELGITIVGPLLVCLLLITLLILLLNKAAPALNLFTAGISIRAGASLFAFFVLLPQLAMAIEGSFGQGEEFLNEFLASMTYEQ